MLIAYNISTIFYFFRRLRMKMDFAEFIIRISKLSHPLKIFELIPDIHH